MFVTNGGYGSVKADVNARAAWSGVGIDLASNAPTPEALRQAVRAVLDKPNYRSRASAMAEELGRIDTRSEILRIVTEVAQGNSGEVIPRRHTMAAS